MTISPDEADEETAALVQEILDLIPPPKPVLHQTPLIEEELAEAAAEEADAIADGLEATPAPFEVLPTVGQELADRPTHCLAPVGLGSGFHAGTMRATPNELLRTVSRAGAVDAVIALMTKGAKPDKPSKTSGYTALHQACEHGHTAVALLLVRRGKAKVDAVTHGGEGKTPLLLAATNGHSECVWTLVEELGANLEARDRELGWAPLIWAAVGGHARTCAALLRLGAFKEAKAEVKFDPVRRGMTALQAAEACNTSGSHDETLKVLRGWEAVVAHEGVLALERQGQLDERKAMSNEEDASLVYEKHLRGIAAVAARVAAEEEAKRLAEEKEQRAYNRDLRRLTEDREKVEELMAEAKEAEDWEQFEELDDILQAIPTTVEGYRERLIQRKEEAAAAQAAAQAAEEEEERWLMLEEDEREDSAQYEEEAAANEEAEAKAAAEAAGEGGGGAAATVAAAAADSAALGED